VLLTRSPLSSFLLANSRGPFDLHVLGTPPAFVLSQDQTLHEKPFGPQEGPIQTENPKLKFIRK
jgi:hypothetical protein